MSYREAAGMSSGPRGNVQTVKMRRASLHRLLLLLLAPLAIPQLVQRHETDILSSDSLPLLSSLN